MAAEATVAAGAMAEVEAMVVLVVLKKLKAFCWAVVGEYDCLLFCEYIRGGNPFEE